MKFQKGNRIRLGKPNPNAGRKKSLSTLIKQVMADDLQHLPAYFQSLSEKALGGDRESAFYLIDRHLGKAKAIAEIDLKKPIGAILQVELFQMLIEMKGVIDTKLLKEGENGQDSEGKDEALP